MLHYGGPTPKRHYAFSNSRWVAKLDLGKLRGWAQRKKVLKTIGKGYDLVDHYVDAQGKKRWKGNRLLRSSELGAYQFLKQITSYLASSSIFRMHWNDFWMVLGCFLIHW